MGDAFDSIYGGINGDFWQHLGWWMVQKKGSIGLKFEEKQIGIST